MNARSDAELFAGSTAVAAAAVDALDWARIGQDLDAQGTAVNERQI